jgi:hypothetical protein
MAELRYSGGIDGPVRAREVRHPTRRANLRGDNDVIAGIVMGLGLGLAAWVAIIATIVYIF